ncbi:hypothetical protein ADEAN_000507600 [Angomonas deanei]|uniref:RING-type domain-containing protein n=1 Tax=Angomonas deanei TaxID=59799 RepID=A0A7G2CCQ0_9TRYP|nr:hypothetical protein ADEAN_000507600 [Angomonas deanei]
MAGLQSQNISVASARGPAAAGGRQSDRSTCIFCKSKSTPSAADPHAPVFAFFSLADCRHYACQPCALVHCDATGRHIYCPSCQCTSRLSQSGKRRTGSKAGRREQEKERVGIDDGVSSVASRRSKGHTPRSALRKDNAERRAHSSVQFAKEPEEGRSTSPLTRETVAQVPSDPALARKRAQEDEELSQATKASEPGMGLFSLTAPKPRRLRKRSESKERDGSKERRGSKERKKSASYAVRPRSQVTAVLAATTARVCCPAAVGTAHGRGG